MKNPHEQITLLRQLASVGQFISSFEWCCWSLRQCSQDILQLRGLRDYPLSEIIFNQRSFTAEPLFECYASICSHVTGRNSSVIGELDSLRKIFKDLIKKRNDLMHGTYMLAPGAEMSVEKRTPDKYGARLIEVVSSESELADLINQCVDCRNKIHYIFALTLKSIIPAS